MIAHMSAARALVIPAVGGVWLYACIASWWVDSDAFVQSMFFVWVTTIFVLPLAFAPSAAFYFTHDFFFCASGIHLPSWRLRRHWLRYVCRRPL